MEIKLLYNDKNYTVAVKPRGVLSQSASAATGNVPNMVELLAGQTAGEIFPVHRLDRETAGVMVYAKNKRAAAAFSALAAQNGLDKTYLAAVSGIPSPADGEMRDLLYHDVKKNKSYVVSRRRGGVKEALLSYTTLQSTVCAVSNTPITLVRVHLHTGRTHQIRVQFAFRGLPLLGDTRYGCPIKAPFGLFAEQLAFIDPFSGQQKCFSAQPDENLSHLFDFIDGKGAAYGLSN